MEIHRLIFSPIEVNTYIIEGDGGKCAVIDCGCYGENEFRRLEEFLREKGLRPALLLNTHMHLDHIFGNRYMAGHYNLLTLCSREEEANRLNAVQHAMMFGLEMDIPPAPGRFIGEGDSISFGKVSLVVLSCPGHTAGGLAFHCGEAGAVFTGDTLFSGSIGRTDLPGGDYDTLIRSINEKLLVLDPATTVYPGHGPSSTIEIEKSSNPYLV